MGEASAPMVGFASLSAIARVVGDGALIEAPSAVKEKGAFRVYAVDVSTTTSWHLARGP